MRRFRGLLRLALPLALTLGLLVSGDAAKEGAVRGARLCGESLIPALQAKLDELLRANSKAKDQLTTIDEEEPEEIERQRREQHR